MTLQDCYAAMGSNYEDVLGRLRSERLVRKFAMKFLDDQSYELFCASMKEKNAEEAFRAVHTIKGICQNLGFTRLLESSSLMSDALRHGWTDEAETLAGRLEEDYRTTVDAIRSLIECEGQ